MKTGIHPNYQQINVKCSCGANFKVGSTSTKDLSVEICSECHPFFTGKQKLVDTAGRLDRFQKRMKVFEEMKSKGTKGKEKKEEVAEPKAKAAKAPKKAKKAAK